MPVRPVLPVILALALMESVQAAVPSEPYRYGNAAIVAGGFVPGIVFHPTAAGVAYARSDMGGTYRLDAATRRWIPITDFANDYVETGIESIALDPTDPERVYALVGTEFAEWTPKAFLLRSTDRGNHWERIPMPFKCGGNNDGRSIGERLAVDPQSPNVLFAGSRQAGLWRSQDHGSTWAQVGSFPFTATTSGTWANMGVGFVLFAPGTDPAAVGQPSATIYAGVAAAPHSLFRSTDAGATWAPIPGQPEGQVPHHGVLASDGTLYVTYSNGPGPNGVSDGAVWKLDTATGAWTDITPKPKGQGGFAGLTVDPRQPRTVMVTTLDRWWPEDEQYRSTDGGATWTPVGPTAERDPSASPWLTWGNPGRVGSGNWEGCIQINPANPDHVLYVTGATIWGCDDIGNLDQGQPTHWTVQAQGIEQTSVIDLISPAEGPRLVTGLGDIWGFVHTDLDRSPPVGMRNPTLTNTALDYAGLKPAVLVRVGWTNDQGVIRGGWSTDHGATWQPFASAPEPGSGTGSVAVTADGAAILWAPEGKSAYRTTDGGATWTAATGLVGSVALTADRADPLRIYAMQTTGPKGHEARALARSGDGGRNFSPGAAGVVGGRLKAVPGLAGHLWLAGSDGLFRSTDGGATVVPVPRVTRSFNVGFGAPAPGATHPAVFLSGTVDGVTGLFRSDDAGAGWVRINDDQHAWGGIGGALSGDLRTWGRFYLGTNGRGVIIGDRLTSP